MIKPHINTLQGIQGSIIEMKGWSLAWTILNAPYKMISLSYDIVHFI